MFRRPRSPVARIAAAVRGIAICALLLLLVAGIQQARAQSDYRFGPGDVLSIMVFGQQGLSGQFKVSAGGTISYPLLGQIEVADLTSAELETELGGRLAEQLPALGRVSVEVAEYAPVFVVGDVATPGRFQFRPGMTVLELIALGGGLRQPNLAAAGDPVLQMISLEQELYDLRLTRYGHAVHRARLRAEMEGREFDGSIAADEDQPITLAHKMRILEDEKTLFRVRADVLANRERALREQHASYDHEIEALTQGIKLHNQELAYLTQELNSAQGLVDRGLATQTRLLALKREQSATKRSALEMESFLARARQNQLAVELQINELHNTRANEVAVELREVDLAIARADERLATISSTLLELGSRAGSRLPDPAGTVRYEIVRMIEGEHKTLPGNELSELRPLDILQVRRQPAELSPPEAAQPGTAPEKHPAKAEIRAAID